MADSPDIATAAPQTDLARAQREIMDKRGYSFSEFEWLAEKDPAYEKARLEYAGMIYTRENPVLPVKYREIIAAVILAFRGYSTLDRHVRRALREGATMQEVIEAFEVATVPGGMPVLHFALPYLMEIDREESAKAGG
jgi:alkylhydroperoxidase/carboxymuconolactone decarboxylase family protein YurZ